MIHASSLEKTAVLTGFEAGPNAAGIPHVDWLPTEGWHELWQKQCVHLCRQQQPACANLYLRACMPHRSHRIPQQAARSRLSAALLYYGGVA